MLQIRPFSAEDILTVAQIEQASRPTPWSEKQFKAELENSNSRPLVLVGGDGVGINSSLRSQIEPDPVAPYLIGYVIPWFIAGEIQIQNIVVVHAHRGKGLGNLLLNVALTKGLDAGCDQAILEVRESNKPAISLYHRYKFSIVGRRENYYRDGETALLMTAGPFDTVADLANYREFISKEAERLKDRLQFQIK